MTWLTEMRARWLTLAAVGVQIVGVLVLLNIRSNVVQYIEDGRAAIVKLGMMNETIQGDLPVIRLTLESLEVRVRRLEELVGVNDRAGDYRD